MKRTYKNHGKSKTKLYNIWSDIKKRVFCTTSRDYKDYGGRGITMQSNWINNFLKFEAYVTGLESYDKDNLGIQGLYLDRTDNDGNYEEGNLRWTTMTMQKRNQRMNVTNTSGFVGVSFHKKSKKYDSRIMVNKKQINLGYRKTAKEAYQLRLDYIKKHNLKGFNQ